MNNSIKPISKALSILFMAGGALMVISAGCFVFFWHRELMCWIFLLGAVLFTLVQAQQTYQGDDLALKRLKRIQSMAGLCFIIGGMLMADTAYGFFRPLFHNYIDYVTYVYNKWVVFLLIGAVIEVYTVHRIDYLLSKKNIKG